jgi:hypothetical protein
MSRDEIDEIGELTGPGYDIPPGGRHDRRAPDRTVAGPDDSLTEAAVGRVG